MSNFPKFQVKSNDKLCTEYYHNSVCSLDKHLIKSLNISQGDTIELFTKKKVFVS